MDKNIAEYYNYFASQNGDDFEEYSGSSYDETYEYYKTTKDAYQAEQCEDLHKSNDAMAVFISLITIIGLFGNAIVFFVILVLKEYRKSVAHWYVLQLAIADTLFLLMLPFSAHAAHVGKWKMPEGLCKAKEGLTFVNYYASIAFLTIMSFDRYIAVSRVTAGTGWCQDIRTLPYAIIISLAAWCGCIALGSPLYKYSTVDSCQQCNYEFPQTNLEKCQIAGVNETYCDMFISNNVTDMMSIDFSEFNYQAEDFFSPDQLKNFTEHAYNTTLFREVDEVCKDDPAQSLRVWVYLNFTVAFLLPLAAICIFYGLILTTMMSTGKIASSDSQRRYRRRVTLMVLALVTLFTICWLPWHAVKIARIQGFKMGANGCKKLLQFTFVLAYLNSALNPYFYSFMGSHFHRRFAKARATATRSSRLLSALSKMSAHGDSNSSQTEKSKQHGHKKPLNSSTCFKPEYTNDSEKTVQQTERTTV